MDQEILITGIKVDKYLASVPHGLSDLVNTANAWSIEKPKSLGYNREVIRGKGRVITILTKIN